MRPVVLGLLVVAGCVGFHPRDPEWRRPGKTVAVDATGGKATAPRARPQWQVIGKSVEGRPLRLLRLGHGPRRVLWIGGIHGDEREGHFATAELPRAFFATPGAEDAVTLTILEDVNPDGSAANTRSNKNGVDLNRNYPANNWLPGDSRGTHPLDQPEAKVVHDLVLDERPHLVIVAHAWRGDHFINFDGPAERHAELFAQRSGYRVKPSDKIAPTPGSLGSWIGRKLGIPILTLEYERGSDPRTDWRETRDAILAVVLLE
ncbi:MAG: M14 family zinc carboxypeptidase [Planctomycetota bacterium]